MKLYDFGLWFGIWEDNIDRTYSFTIPKEGICTIFYDGVALGLYHDDFYLEIWDDQPLIMNLKGNFNDTGWSAPNPTYFIGRPLTLDDFDVSRTTTTGDLMKLCDFGLWFCGFDGYWSATIPQETSYGIYHDGIFLGRQYHNFNLIIKIKSEDPYIIKLEDHCDFDYSGWDYAQYKIGRLLTLEDFEIIPNPDYQEQK